MERDIYNMKMKPVEPEYANPAQFRMLDKALKEFQMIPNMYKAMANLPGLLETYRLGYDRFREQGDFSPAEQEIVFLTISTENACNYCMVSHGVYARMAAQVPEEVIQGIKNKSGIPDEKLKQLSHFTSIMVAKRGNPTEEDVRSFLDAGYAEHHIMSIILAIAVKTLSNYTNHLFRTEVDERLKAMES